MSEDAKVGVVIVNYNGFEYVVDCVKSLMLSTWNNLDIIVVDNGSSDGSVDKLGEMFGDSIIVVDSGVNLGFAGGNNVGIRLALERQCEYILLLNNDTVVDNFMIENLVRCSQISGGAAVAPKIYYYDQPNLIWFAGGGIHWVKGISVHYGLNCLDDGRFDTNKAIDFATGCCVLVPAGVFRKVGLMSEEYFLYFEDTDFTVRLKRAGFNIVYEPHAKLWHKVCAATGRGESKMSIYYGDRNRLYFNWKFNDCCKTQFRFYYLASRFLKVVMWAIKGEFWKIRLLREAIRDFISGKMGMKDNL